MHVTIRVAADIPALRTPKLYPALRAATINVAERQQRFRLCQLSIQNSHVHLIVEADDKIELARGMRSFEVSIAKRLNRLLGRRGKVFTDRYHLVVIRSPKQMRATLAYVFVIRPVRPRTPATAIAWASATSSPRSAVSRCAVAAP